MAVLIVALAILPLIVLLVYSFKLSSRHALDVKIPLIFIQLLLKYIPGYTAPLRADLAAAVFLFDTITIRGHLSLSAVDIATFGRAVRSTGSPFLLIAKTTPLVIQLLADRRCPIKPLGAVNSRNIITFNRPYFVPPLQKQNLTYVAKFGSQHGIRRKRGVEFSITIDVMSDGEKIIEMELWMLQFLSSSHEPRFKGVSQENVVKGEAVSSICITAKDPELWAESCKDYNPIHVSQIGAKLFGFKNVIAHGNHVAALVLQETGVPTVPFTLELDFLRPMLLPATFEVLGAEHDDRKVFTVVSAAGQRAHMQMTVLEHS